MFDVHAKTHSFEIENLFYESYNIEDSQNITFKKSYRNQNYA